MARMRIRVSARKGWWLVLAGPRVLDRWITRDAASRHAALARAFWPTAMRASILLVLSGCATEPASRPWVAVTRGCQPDVARCERGTLLRAFPSHGECVTVMSAWAEAKITRMSMRAPLTNPRCVEVDTGVGDVFLPDGFPLGPVAR